MRQYRNVRQIGIYQNRKQNIAVNKPKTWYLSLHHKCFWHLASRQKIFAVDLCSYHRAPLLENSHGCCNYNLANLIFLAKNLAFIGLHQKNSILNQQTARRFLGHGGRKSKLSLGTFGCLEIIKKTYSSKSENLSLWKHKYHFHTCKNYWTALRTIKYFEQFLQNHLLEVIQNSGAPECDWVKHSYVGQEFRASPDRNITKASKRQIWKAFLRKQMVNGLGGVSRTFFGLAVRLAHIKSDGWTIPYTCRKDSPILWIALQCGWPQTSHI